MVPKRGKAIVSVAEALDFSTAAGRLFANLLAMFAQFERERISERRAEAAVKLAHDGKLNTGNCSVGYGYRRGADGKPEIIPAEAEVTSAWQVAHQRDDALRSVRSLDRGGRRHAARRAVDGNHAVAGLREARRALRQSRGRIASLLSGDTEP